MSVGQELIVSKKQVFAEDIGPLGRRKVHSIQLPDGMTQTASEFSLLSLVQQDRLLKTLFSRTRSIEKSVTEKILRTHACLGVTTASHGSFQFQ